MKEINISDKEKLFYNKWLKLFEDYNKGIISLRVLNDNGFSQETLKLYHIVSVKIMNKIIYE